MRLTKRFNPLNPKWTRVRLAIGNATTTTKCSVNELQKISSELVQTKNELQVAIEKANEANKQLALFQQEFKVLSEKTQAQSQESTSKLKEFTELLESKEIEILQAKKDIKRLNTTLDSQLGVPNLTRGEYQIFDDFHPEAKGVLVVNDFGAHFSLISARNLESARVLSAS